MNKTALLAAIVVALVGVALFGLYMRRFETEAAGGEPIEVLMVNSDMAIGEPLTDTNVSARPLPEAYVEDRHVRVSDLRRVLGVRVNAALRANQSLLWSDLATSGSERRDLATLLREGMRAMTVRTGVTSAFGGLLRAGDRVDVLLTATRPGSVDETRVTVPLLQNVLVLAVGTDTGGPDQTQADESQASASRRGRDVSLAVTLEQATMLTHARDRGLLQLVLRNPDDVAIVEGVPETTDTDLIEAEFRQKIQRRRQTMETIMRIE
jgi:pilus assembly protein CpaB